MTHYDVILASVLIYTVGDMMAWRGIRKGNKALYYAGSGTVAIAFATLLLVLIWRVCGA